MAHLGSKNATQLFTIVVGSPQTLQAAEFSIPYPMTVFANPGAGGTLLVEYRISPDGSWIEWPAGAVAVDTVYVSNGPVEGLRFTALLADGVVEVAQ